MVHLKSVASKSVGCKMGGDKNETTVATSCGNLNVDSRIAIADKDL